MAVAEVARLIDGGPYFADEAHAAGLVDRLSYWPDVLEQARAPGRRGRRAGVAGRLCPQRRGRAGRDAPVIALVQGVGQIQRGDSDYGPAGGWVMGADTDRGRARRRDRRSGGRARSCSGSIPAAARRSPPRRIGRQVRRAVEQGKPVIVSMADVAASGGYWIAMDASRIVAEPGTLTGSIGVFAGKPVLREFWHEMGVNWGQVRAAPMPPCGAPAWATTSTARARLEAFLDQIYAAFVAGVARGRGLSRDEVLEVAQGRVWTGAQAKDLGLVDELGGFDRALALAKEAVGIAPHQPVELRPFPRALAPGAGAGAVRGSPGRIEAVRAWLQLLGPACCSAPPLAIR